jgi:predicted branched-subunit amino acid permease
MIGTPSGRRHEIIAGASAMAPWLLGVVPLGLVVGMNAPTSGVSPGLGLLTGPVISSGILLAALAA